jgi:hypothetical protein
MEFVDFISIPRVDNVVLTEKTKEKTKNCKIEGTLCISGHHLILSDRQKNNQQELWVIKISFLYNFIFIKLFLTLFLLNIFLKNQNNPLIDIKATINIRSRFTY